MRRVVVIVSLSLVLLAGLYASSIRAQQARQDPDILDALLVEVRGLRAALEQLGSAGPRVQLAMGRLQLNEQRITTAEETLRKRQQSLNDWTEAIQQSGRAPSEDAQNEVQKAKTGVAEATALVTQLRLEETRLAQGITAEQDQWKEINERLEALDRALGRR